MCPVKVPDVAILATLAGVNIFAAFKLGTTGRLKFSSTAGNNRMIQL